MKFLPVKKEDIESGESLDFILVSGDAYVDHPSFGAAIIGRLLESRGYSVGIIPQPNWNSPKDFQKLGKPRLGFLVTGGNIDSMVNHYTVAKKRRRKDYYSPGGQMGLRPDRATIVYSNKLREYFGNIPIILGGIEASLRRLSHYDYWDDKVRRSILLDSNADILVYGMGEHQIIEIAEALDAGIPIEEITFITGTVYKTKDLSRIYDYIELPHYKVSAKDKSAYSDSFLIQYENTDHITAKNLVEPYNECYVVQNIPTPPLETSEFDRVYSLDYVRDYHYMYEEQGGIPAIEEVKFSIINNRGCFGDCNFCALTFHQGRVVQSRSHSSIISEAEKISWLPNFKGYIHDVGGPTANFRFPSCKKQITKGSCKNKRCLYPKPCENLNVTHEDYFALLKKLRELPNVKKVFVRSGIRFDYLIADKNNSKYIRELCKHHISGQLKVAPEHTSKKVLDKMGKPPIEVFEKFKEKYYNTNKDLGKEQYLVPYLMSSHPGCDLKAAIELSEYLKKNKLVPEQVQDFYPTPGTYSTCVYYTEFDPITKESVYVEKNPHRKAIQRALMQFSLPKNYDLAYEGIMKAGRDDLIGFSENCLLRPRSRFKPKPKEKVKKEAPIKKKTIRNVHKKKNDYRR